MESWVVTNLMIFFVRFHKWALNEIEQKLFVKPLKISTFISKGFEVFLQPLKIISYQI